MDKLVFRSQSRRPNLWHLNSSVVQRNEIRLDSIRALQMKTKKTQKTQSRRFPPTDTPLLYSRRQIGSLFFFITPLQIQKRRLLLMSWKWWASARARACSREAKQTNTSICLFTLVYGGGSKNHGKCTFTILYYIISIYSLGVLEYSNNIQVRPYI